MAETKTKEAARRIAEKVGLAKRDLIDAYNVATIAGLAGYARTLDRLCGEVERLQNRVAKATGSAQ